MKTATLQSDNDMRKTAILLFVLAILGARSIVAADSYSAVTFSGSPKTNINAGSIVLSNITAGSVLKVDSNKKVQAASLSDIETALSKDVLTKDEIDTQAEFEAKLFALPSGGGSVSVNGSEVENPDFDDSATLTWGVVGSTISATVANLTAAALATDSVSADELDAAGVRDELEAQLRLQQLQGAVTDAQVPNNITVDLATVATTANAGDSATAFFSSGEIEDARLPSALARDAEVAAGYQPLDADLTSAAAGITGLVKGLGNGNGYSAATAGTDYFAKSGSSAAGDVAVFDGTDQTLRRSTSAANFGDSSSATFTVNFGLSGATDPTITAVNGAMSLNVPLTLTSGNFLVQAGSSYRISGRGYYASSGDGILLLTDNAATSFDRLQLGGTSSSFPALKRTSTQVDFKLADNSAFTSIGTGIVELNKVASGGTPGTDAARIYALNDPAEIYVKDESGNETLISPHPDDVPAVYQDLEDGLQDLILSTKNDFVGKIEWVQVSRGFRFLQLILSRTNLLNQMGLTNVAALPANKRTVHAVESYASYNARRGLTGTNALTVKVWATEQQKLQDVYDALREIELSAYNTATTNADGTISQVNTNVIVRPVADIRKPKPAWMQ